MLAIVTTHPIQYQAPLWRALAADGHVPFEVWFLTDHGTRRTFDAGFGREFAWDIPLLDGYRHQFLEVHPGWTITAGKPLSVRLRENLGDRIRAAGVDAVWVQGWQVLAYWQAVWQARRAGSAVWLRGESNDLALSPGWLKARLKRVMLRSLFRRVDEFLCIGSGNRRLYQKYGIPDARLHPAPYCVDNARLAAETAALQPQRAAIRAEWGVPEDACALLFCGKFIPKKRPVDLVLAAAMAQRDAGRPLHLLFAGTGELGGELRARCSVVFDAEGANPGRQSSAAPGDVRPRASFLGFVNQSAITRAYVAADALVLPSDTGETWGLVANEAMACGLPCAVSASCGCAEDLVQPVDPEMVFACGDLAGIARSARRLRAGHGRPAQAWREQAERFGYAPTVGAVARLYAASVATEGRAA